MPLFYSVFYVLLDIAPLSWAPLFLMPVLIIGIVVAAVAILVHSIRGKKKDFSAKQEEYKDSDSKKQ